MFIIVRFKLGYWMFPLPFLIALAFLVLAFLTSKLQNQSTYLLIAIYAALGPIETGAIVVSTVNLIRSSHNERIITFLLIAALSTIFLINLLGYVIQTPYLLSDRRFLKWANRKSKHEQIRSNLIWFHIVSFVSFLSSYKLKMVLFSRLFNFECFKFQLVSIEKFKAFNVLSFIGYCPEILALYCCVMIIAYSNFTSDELLPFIDCLIMVLLNMAFSIVIIRKDKSFFRDEIDGIPINHVSNMIEQMNSATEIIQQKQREKRKRIKGKLALDDISELDEFAYTSTKRDRNLKFGTGVKEEKEESCYFEVNSEENTGSQIHSQLGHSERLENEVGVGAQEEQVEEIGNQQNILDIDQVYEDESNDRMSNNEEFARSHLISYEQPLELPPQKCDPDNKGMQINSKILQVNVTNQRQEEARKTHTKLSDYLLSHQGLQEPKGESTPTVIAELEPQSTKEAEFKFIDYAIDSGTETERVQQKFTLLINQSALIDSQPSVLQHLTPHQCLSQPKEQLTAQYDLETAKEDLQTAKNIVSRVVSAHHSPKKYIQTSEDRLAMLEKLKRSIKGVSLNEQHDDKPIKNKSLEKIRRNQQHPINSAKTDHPIYGQRQVNQQSNSQSESETQSGTRLKVKTEAMDRQLPKDHHQNVDYEHKPHFYDEFLHEQGEGNHNQFKRSPQSYSLALFSKKQPQLQTVIAESQSTDNVPRQPTHSLTNAQSKQSTFILKRNLDRNSAIKFCSNPRARPQTSTQKGRIGKYSLQKSLPKGIESRRLLSLQKIYLQKLSNP